MSYGAIDLSSDKTRATIRKVLWGTAAVFVALLLIVALLGLFPVRVRAEAQADPADSYNEALTRIAATNSEERGRGDIMPDCESILMGHGDRTAETIVFFHGFTSCPRQFAELGELFYAKGYNVYIPLAPYHGHVDRRGLGLKELRANDLATHGMEAIDIARGLGDRVTVVGLSGGGAVAAWVAQNRDDVALVAPIAPLIGVSAVPGTYLNRGFTHLLSVIPDFYNWWDRETREDNPESPPYAYVGHPFTALRAYMQLGFSTLRQAEQQAPSAAALMILNDADTTTSNSVADLLADYWETGGTPVTRYYFSDELALPHDLISAFRADLDVSVVYPVLVDLLTEAGGQDG